MLFLFLFDVSCFCSKCLVVCCWPCECLLSVSVRLECLFVRLLLLVCLLLLLLSVVLDTLLSLILLYCPYRHCQCHYCRLLLVAGVVDESCWLMLRGCWLMIDVVVAVVCLRFVP